MLSVGVSKKHSTETALLYVTSAIKTAMDNKQGTTLVLVDFSAAFDTINHDILIKRLRLRYGFVGKALDWIISYLQEWTQRIVIGGHSSSTTTLTASVPQGSVLGPLLFSLYVQPIDDIIRAHGLFFHHYANDLQIYSHVNLNPSALAAVVQQMEDCLDDIKQWMAWNSKCMNDGKTQNLSIVPKSAAALVDGSVIRVGVSTITASRCGRNIGVFIDRHLDMKKQVSQAVSACSFYLRHINQISHFLPKPTKERVINAIITSRLDYCNALLYGTSVVNIACLQRIHNSAARLILRCPRSESARPLLQERH